MRGPHFRKDTAGNHARCVVVGPVDSIHVYCIPLREVREFHVPHFDDFGIGYVCFGVVRRTVVCKAQSLEAYGESSQSLAGSQRGPRLGMYYDLGSADNYEIFVPQLEEDMEGMIGRRGCCDYLVGVDC